MFDEHPSLRLGAPGSTAWFRLVRHAHHTADPGEVVFEVVGSGLSATRTVAWPDGDTGTVPAAAEPAASVRLADFLAHPLAEGDGRTWRSTAGDLVLVARPVPDGVWLRIQLPVDDHHAWDASVELVLGAADLPALAEDVRAWFAPA